MLPKKHSTDRLRVTERVAVTGTPWLTRRPARIGASALLAGLLVAGGVVLPSLVRAGGTDCLIPDSPDPEPTVIHKNRFISFKVPSSAAGREIAIRVTLTKMYNTDPNDPVNAKCTVRGSGCGPGGTCNLNGDTECILDSDCPPQLSTFDGQVRWVGPHQYLPEDFDPDPPADPSTNRFFAAELQCVPYFADWDAILGGGVLNVYGAEVVPCSLYTVELVDISCPDLADASCYSASLPIHTALWGDVWEPFGNVNFTDIGKIVDKFKGVEGAPPKVRAILHGNASAANRVVSFSDIGNAVDAWKSFAYAEDGPSSCQADDCLATVVPEPGFARPWEADIRVSTYSWVNTRHRNIITAIPIIAWSGKGPDMDMVFYHNSALVDSPPPNCVDLKNVGFDLGLGWTIAYSDQVCLDDPNTPNSATVVHEDGSWDLFTWNADTETWEAPAGVHDELTGEGALWTLKHEDQSYHEFAVFPAGNSDGRLRLTKVFDSVGRSITVNYEGAASNPPIRIKNITDASTRQLLFEYYTGGELHIIKDPDEPNEPSISDREWTFPTDNFLDTIEDPMSFITRFTYDGGRIKTITDKGEGYFYTYDYDTEGRIEKVTDPGVAPLTQLFSTACSDGTIVTTYTDRRGSQWLYTYNDPPDLPTPDGNLNRSQKPDTTAGSYFVYDGDRNLVQATDELGRTSVATYDANGNMLTHTVDPCGLNLLQTWTYNNDNNVTSYTEKIDSQGNTATVTFNYDDPTYSTLLTSIVEQAVGDCEQDPNACPATTTLEYHSSRLLKKVTDPNGVVTTFDYDQWGQLNNYTEGEVAGNPVYEEDPFYDSGTRLIRNPTCYQDQGGAAGAGASYNLNNSQTGSGSCIPRAAASAGGPSVPQGFPVLPCNLANWPDITGEFDNALYTPMGELKSLPMNYSDNSRTWSRLYTADYDDLGRMIDQAVQSTGEVTGGPFTRAFTYEYDPVNGTMEGVGPDNLGETVIQSNTSNQVTHVERREPDEAPFMSADYSYYANGLLESVTYGNGASTWYTYDEADRLESIDHRNAVGDTILKLAYMYTSNSLPKQITETDVAGTEVGKTNFEYDARSRLTKEYRTLSDVYDLSYEYDQGGNRTKKIDATGTGKQVCYHYDLEDPTKYQSNNNRVEYYEEFETICGDCDQQGCANPATTTYYYYWCNGNPNRIVTHVEGTQDYSAVRFEYARNGVAVTHVLGETWTWDGASGCESNNTYDVTFAREFRPEGARARYYEAVLDKDSAEVGEIQVVSEMWSDYDEDEVYGDYTVTGGSPPTITDVRSFEAGLGRSAWTAGVPGAADYYHRNHLGTTRFMTNSNAAQIESGAFTAFGERINGSVSGPEDRYGYAGAWGYQAHRIDEVDPPMNPEEAFPYLHVGHRYYDPATGRFLQRDPIGIDGGLNVYEYVDSAPTVAVDPFGLVSSVNPVSLARAGFSAKEIADILGVTVACAVVATKATRRPKASPAPKRKAKRRPYVPNKPGQKKASREQRNKNRQKDNFKQRNPPRETKPHTPSKKHRGRAG